MLYDKKRWEPKLPELKPKPKLKPWQKALINAADYIRKHGWTQGTYERHWGAVCAIGALQRVTCHSIRQEAYYALADAIGDPYEFVNPAGAILQFNDHKTTTKRKVLAMFRKAAKVKANAL